VCGVHGDCSATKSEEVKITGHCAFLGHPGLFFAFGLNVNKEKARGMEKSRLKVITIPLLVHERGICQYQQRLSEEKREAKATLLKRK
jgi:hypothetical protein